MKQNLLLMIHNTITEKHFTDIIKTHQNSCKIIIVTNNLEIKSKFINFDAISEIILLEEEPITIFDVSNEVINLCESINKCLIKYIDNSGLLHYMKHVEGGHTSYKVQDIIIYSLLLDNIFKKHTIHTIIDIFDKDYIQDSRILQEYASILNISYTYVAKFSINNIKTKFISRLKPFLYEPYRFIKFIKFNLFCSKRNIIDTKNTVVFALNSTAIKFIELYSSLTKKLDRVNINYYFLTSGISKNHENLHLFKKKIYILEHYEKLFDYFSSFVKTNIFIFRYYKNKNKILEDLYMDNSPIRLEILNSIMQHIIIDTGYRYRYRTSTNRFLKENQEHIMAFKLWGETSLVEGEISNDAINNYFKHIKTIGFEVGIGLKSFPYVPKSIQKIDIVLTSNSLETDLYSYYGVQKNKILQLKNFKHKFSINEFKKEYNIQDSKKILNIEKNYKAYILIDISSPLRGYQSLSEIYNFIFSIPKLAEYFKDYCFLIKPHPNFNNYQYLKKILLTDNENINIFIFDSSLSIMHFLNIADIVITKFSAIGLEAIYFDKLVISTLPQKQYGFKAYENAAIYIDNNKGIYDCLKNLNQYKIEMQKNIEQYKSLLLDDSCSVSIKYFISHLQKDKND